MFQGLELHFAVWVDALMNTNTSYIIHKIPLSVSYRFFLLVSAVSRASSNDA
jgi:hypothetical protein